VALLGSVLEAFWWQRFTAVGDGAMTPAQVDRVIDEVLLPVVTPSIADDRGALRPAIVC